MDPVSNGDKPSVSPNLCCPDHCRGPDQRGRLGRPALQITLDTAAKAGSFEALVAAVTAAGLVDTLKGEGPFTVFAPTDETFAAPPEGTVEVLLEHIPALTAILTCRVVPGNVTSGDLSDGMMAATVNGAGVTIGTMSGVTVNDANVVSADIESSNGAIHVIAAVMRPPES